MSKGRFRLVRTGAEWFAKNIKCQDRCPAHTDVPRYVSLIAQGRFADAYEVNRTANVIPAILGRVCVRLCEGACRRRDLDETVSICHLKRSAADFGRLGTRPGTPIERKRQRVGIVGAGPTGLTAASDLAQLGYRVAIFEALPVVGGMLRVGIPPYRLPRDVIQNTIIQDLESLGVDIHLNRPVGKDIGLDHLIRIFDAVLIAAGAHKPEKLGIPGEHLDGVLHGVTFMRRANLGEPTGLGERVAVIGLGHTAIDCARSAVRLGAKSVHVIYRRTAAEAAVGAEEIEEAEEEGVTFHYLVSPTAINSDDQSRIVGLACVRNALGEPDASGRRRPVPVPGSEFILPVDTVIPAVSQSPDITFLPPEIGLEMSRWDRLEVDKRTFMTNKPGVFAAGDFITGPRDVIGVIADAHAVSASIDAYLNGGQRLQRRAKFTVLQRYQRDGDYLTTQRAPMPTLPTAERASLQEEVELGLALAAARTEATRCLQCQINVMIDSTRCVLCGLCIDACPQGVLRMVAIEALSTDDQTAVSLGGHLPTSGAAMVIDEKLCIRCGLCENRCPTKAISMVQFEWEAPPPAEPVESAPQMISQAASRGSIQPARQKR
ncbi:MAG: 4Fe-4S dicluster domain-containing protein [Chloroflexota bacterium]|nr:MAG: 4Fe-4S dicluster domain-containing protein [Chloroflexota bacterium]